MPGTFYRNRFTWLAYLLLAFYGYFLNVLGPITPFLKDELGLNYTVSSLHFTAFAVGILGVGLFGHLVINRIGRRWSLWLGAGGMALGSLLLLVGRTPVLTIAGSFCMGLVGSLILAIIPSALADQYGEARAIAISEANTVSSLAGAGAPLLVGWFAASLSNWRLALEVFVLVPVIFWFVFRTARPPQPAATTANAVTGRPLPGRYWVYWVALVLVVSVEFCMVFWSADFLETGLGMLKADAATAVSLFLGGMIVGRFGVSRLVRPNSTTRWTIASILVAAGGFLLYWGSPSVPPALAGLFVTGLGVAGLYPLIISMALESTCGNSIQGSARATLASGTAILLLPLLLGWLADQLGIRQAYGLVIVLLAAALLVTLAAVKMGSVSQEIQEL